MMKMMRTNGIKKFRDFLNEGFMSKTYDRLKTGDVRTEDKLNQGDLEIFNVEEIQEFIYKYNLRFKIDQFFHEVNQTYSEPIRNYMLKHGLERCGFGKRDLSQLPDFDYEFRIEKYKDLRVHITYDDFEKEIKITCGEKDEYDISETPVGVSLSKFMKNMPKYVAEQDTKILLVNIKLKWKYFEPELYNCAYHVYRMYLMKDSEFEMKKIPIETDDLTDELIYGYHFEGVDFKRNTMSGPLKLFGASSSKSNPTYKKIIGVLDEAYGQARFEILNRKSGN